MRRIISFVISIAFASCLFAANNIVSVEKVSGAITVSDDVDYVITSSDEPFAEGASVNITNLDHAVLIIKKVKPSKVISSYLGKYVLINGQKAVNGSNCQVKMYAEGSIIMPYDKNFKPLTVYSEQNFGGTAVSDFGLENTGGFMNTLSEAKLNNQIRSFKLKRGYMVTFSTRPEGRGYSRCFIADNEDLEFKTLPAVLDKHISSYRVFQWYDAQKKGVASDTRGDYVSLVNASWCYDWGTGTSLLPDIECVPNHIYEDWPSPSSCGSVTYSCHMKTNNEPGNSADDHPQDVATVLANWENLMRTGLRLCSESSHDGSMTHLKAFIDSIDARGWRCDILDLHCYWPAGTFNNLTWYSDHYGNGRPIWISEWVWGASWNNNGAFAVSDRGDFYGNQNNTYNGTKPILDVLNSNPRVERYAYWNSEADCSKIYRGSELSKLGQYYATMESGIGYNRQNEKIPTNPRQHNPGNLTATYDKQSHKVTLRWHEYNGEYNRSMTVMVQNPGSTVWETACEITPSEAEDDYEIVVDGRDGYKYRVDLVDLNQKTRQTNVATAVIDNLEPGDELSFGDNGMRFLGGNRLLNGSFEFGLNEWLNGAGEPLDAPYYQVLPSGGIDGGSYLQCYGNSKSATDIQSVRMVLDVAEGEEYYVSAAGCNNNPDVQRISTTFAEDIELNVRLRLPKVDAWARQGATFTVGNDNRLMIQFRGLGGIAQFDDVMVCRVYTSQADALADALQCAKARAEAFARYNTDIRLSFVNEDVLAFASSATSALDVEAYITLALKAIRSYAEADKIMSDANMLADLSMPQSAGIVQALNAIQGASDVPTLLDATRQLSLLVNEAFDYVAERNLIMSPSFTSVDGWNTKCGTYTGGEQRLSSQAGKTCWNAWWSTAASAGASRTMAVSQQVTKMEHGLYALECKALTQHLCETDQHAFLVHGADTLASSYIPVGLLDLPAFTDDQKWQTLVTPYVYLSDNDTIQIGFIGSKLGAADHRWHPYADPSNDGDNREGWWCATDFNLRHVTVFMRSSDAEAWGTVCLPYSISVPEGVELYQLAGILDTHAALCLESVAPGSTEAGVPYIFHTQGPMSSVTFIESGEKVSRAQTNVNGMRGTFSTTAKYPVGSLVLQDGKWCNIPDAASRYPILPYSGYVHKFSDMPEIHSWQGVTMPTQGIEIIEGIEVIPSSDAIQSRTYNAAGLPVSDSYRGFVIRQRQKQMLK